MLNRFYWKLKRGFDSVLSNNKGGSIIELVLIIVILISLVLVFKNQITAIINEAFNSIKNDSSSILH